MVLHCHIGTECFSFYERWYSIVKQMLGGEFFGGHLELEVVMGRFEVKLLNIFQFV